MADYGAFTSFHGMSRADCKNLCLDRFVGGSTSSTSSSPRSRVDSTINTNVDLSKVPDKRETRRERDRNDPSRLAMAVKILPNIYLGDSRAAQSSTFFDRADISAVLNMTPNVPNTFCEKDLLQYARIPVYDSHGKRDVNLMYQYFPLVTEFMYKTAVIENKNLLVHCALGRQRSCAAIAAYLMKFYDMTPINAMEFILQRKPDAFHWGQSANFAKALNRWYYKLNPDERHRDE